MQRSASIWAGSQPNCPYAVLKSGQIAAKGDGSHPEGVVRAIFDTRNIVITVYLAALKNKRGFSRNCGESGTR